MTTLNFNALLQNKIIILLAFAILCFVIYHDTFNHAFIIYDDLRYIEAIKENDSGIWSLIHWAFTDTVNVNWHPITLLSLTLDYKLYGMNAGGFHATSLAMHFANSYLVFLIFLIISKKTSLSFLVALVFLVHPINVETVSWVAERKGILGAFFTLLSIYFYLRFRTTLKWQHYAISLLSFIAALMSKAVFVTLPILLIILDMYNALSNQGKLNKKYLMNIAVTQLPFFIIAISIGIITVYVHSTAGALITDKYYPLDTRLAKAIAFYPTYIIQLIYPIGFHVQYPYRIPTTFEIWTGSLFLTGLSALAIRYMKKTPTLFLGWFWYVILLFPVSGVIQSGSHLHADRYAYLPLIGIIYLIMYVSAHFLSHYHIKKRFKVLIVSLIVLILVSISWNQHRTWKNSFSVFYNTYSQDPRNVLSNAYLSYLYIHAGKIEEGMRFYLQARKSDSNYLYNYEMTYEALLSQQKPEIALSVLNDALEAVSVLNVSGTAKYNGYRDKYLLTIATIYINQKQYQKANESLENSLRINPDNYDFKFMYGLANYLHGDYRLAEETLLELMALQPEHYQATLLLIKVYRDWDRHQAARLYIKKALSNFPDREDQIHQLASTIEQ